MQNKILLVSLLAGAAALALLVALGGAFFVLSGSTPVQAEEATLDVAPVQQVEPVSNVIEKPVQKLEQVRYNGKSGGCGYEKASNPLVQSPAEPAEVDGTLLTLATTD
ncbi:MAG: hypothetical protein Kow0031_39220 [Anaerolineae bacterium]